MLGFHVHEMDRVSYSGKDEAFDTESYGVASEFIGARYQVRGWIFLSECMGDAMCDREPAVFSASLGWPLMAGHNPGEFRLAINHLTECCRPSFAAHAKVKG